MRTLRLLVTVITRQPPRPVPLYFVDFASKPAWHAPFGFSHVFCQGSLCSIADGTSKTFYLRYGSASKQRNCQIFTICDCDPILRPEVDSHNIGKRTQPRLIEVPIRVFSHDSLA